MCEQGLKVETTRDCGNAPASHVDVSPPLNRKEEEFKEFLTYCLDCLDKGQSVQTIWTGFQGTVE